MARGAEFAFATEERRVVNGEEHTHSGFVDSYWRKGFGVFKVGYGVAYFELFEADDGAYISRVYVVGFLMSHSFESVEFFYFSSFVGSVAMADGYVLSIFEGSSVHSSHCYSSGVAGVVERCD